MDVNDEKLCKNIAVSQHLQRSGIRFRFRKILSISQREQRDISKILESTLFSPLPLRSQGKIQLHSKEMILVETVFGALCENTKSQHDEGFKRNLEKQLLWLRAGKMT